MTSLLPRVEVDPPPLAGEPDAPPDAVVIWLHGLGADGHDFEPIVPALGLAPKLRVRFVFPHAPAIPVTINGGMVMPAWYDIRALDLASRHDEQGIRRSAEQVEALIASERERGVPSERIVVAGFSQGGAVAAHVALRHDERLAGLVLLSSYLVCTDSIEAERSKANRALPVFLAHGAHDPMVAPERGEDARRRLVALGHPVEGRTYRMQHEVCLEEIQDLGVWLRDLLAR